MLLDVEEVENKIPVEWVEKAKSPEIFAQILKDFFNFPEKDVVGLSEGRLLVLFVYTKMVCDLYPDMSREFGAELRKFLGPTDFKKLWFILESMVMQRKYEYAASRQAEESWQSSLTVFETLMTDVLQHIGALLRHVPQRAWNP